MGSLFEDSNQLLIESFEKEIKSGNILDDNEDLRSGKAKVNYNDFISTVVKKAPKEYFNDSFLNISNKDFKILFLTIITKMFPYNTGIMEEIEEFFRCIIPSKSNEILNGICLTGKDDIGNEVKFVEIPSIHYTAGIVCAIHEFIHFHVNKYNIDLNRKKYYEEILSIYGEKIASEYLSTIFDDKDFSRKIESTRLDAIKWHYSDNISEINNLISLYNQLKSDSSNEIGSKMLEVQFPWIKSNNGIKYKKLFDKSLAESYGIGYIYGEGLFEEHLNSDKFKDELITVLTGDKKLQELLDDKNIRMKNRNVVERAKQKVLSI